MNDKLIDKENIDFRRYKNDIDEDVFFYCIEITNALLTVILSEVYSDVIFYFDIEFDEYENFDGHERNLRVNAKVGRSGCSLYITKKSLRMEDLLSEKYKNKKCEITDCYSFWYSSLNKYDLCRNIIDMCIKIREKEM